MGEDTFWMGQKERDRLKALHAVKQGKLTQRQAAEQLKLSERQLRRLLKRYRADGDRAVVHGLRGRKSNHKIAPATQVKAVQALKQPECRDFGPTYAAEYLSNRGIAAAGKDTVRKWMMTAGLWQARKRRVEQVRQWRERRPCVGELVQWDTSVHDWLEGRGETIHFVAMIDDATSRLFARFVRHDSTEENLRVLWVYLERFGRPLEFYTDKAGMFEITPKRADHADAAVPGLTQITRALAELGIDRSSAHSPQAKGRVERCFGTAQDRLVKGLRLAGASTLEKANAYLEAVYLPEWNARWTHAPASPVDAHRPLSELHSLAGSLSHVEQRSISNDYTFQFRNQRYQIAPPSVTIGMRGQKLRVEARLDGSIAARYEGHYLSITPCAAKLSSAAMEKRSAPVGKDTNRGGRSAWMKNFNLQGGRSVWQALRDASCPSLNPSTRSAGHPQPGDLRFDRQGLRSETSPKNAG